MGICCNDYMELDTITLPHHPFINCLTWTAASIHSVHLAGLSCFWLWQYFGSAIKITFQLWHTTNYSVWKPMVAKLTSSHMFCGVIFVDSLVVCILGMRPRSRCPSLKAASSHMNVSLWLKFQLPGACLSLMAEWLGFTSVLVWKALCTSLLYT